MKRLCPKDCPILNKRKAISKMFDLRIEEHEKDDTKELKFTEIGKR